MCFQIARRLILETSELMKCIMSNVMKDLTHKSMILMRMSTCLEAALMDGFEKITSVIQKMGNAKILYGKRLFGNMIQAR